MTGRIQIVRPYGGITTLPEDCRIVILGRMVDRLRKTPRGIFEHMSDKVISDALDLAINGPAPAPDLAPEMIAAGAEALRLVGAGSSKAIGNDYYSLKAVEVYRAMDAARPKAEK